LSGALLPSTHHVHVDMIDQLTTAPADIDREPVSLCHDIPLLRQVLGGEKEFPHDGGMSFIQVVDGGDVLFGDHEHVDRCRGLDVFENDDIVIFMDDVCRGALGDDLTEDTSHALLEPHARETIIKPWRGQAQAACPEP